MIRAYVVGISTYQEDEDIEIRFCIYDEEELLAKKSIFKEYKKPLVVSAVALLALLKELENYKENEIVIHINDPALNEQIKGTSTTKNKEVLKMASLVREKLKRFNKSLIIKDISQNKSELEKWNEVLQP